MLTIAGLYLGFKDPWNQTDAQLKQSQKLLISKKHLVRLIWSSETNLWEAFGSGDLWIAYAWPNDWVQMKKKGLPVVYMRPKEKPIAWVGMFMLLKGDAAAEARARVRRRVELDASRRSGSRTTTATATRTRVARPSSSDLLQALQLTNPRAVTEPNAHLDRDIPRRALYAKMWEEVKAS